VPRCSNEREREERRENRNVFFREKRKRETLSGLTVVYFQIYEQLGNSIPTFLFLQKAYARDRSRFFASRGRKDASRRSYRGEQAGPEKTRKSEPEGNRG
jgi:hypothetical protein